jgi:CO dehydrogenase maturation factor
VTIAIAISGKGGSGKTTLAAMIIRLLLHRQNKAVLAVDADPNSCLGLTLGVQPLGTIAEIREQARSKSPTSPGMSRVQSFEYGIQQAITEADGFDLLTMGRPEGPDCYCAANNLLRQFLDKLSSAYDFVVIDNEAGMEHLSRRTTNNVDFLCIVAEPTPLGAVTAKRIFDLAEQLPISVKQIGVIWNRAESAKELNGIETFGCIPFDESVFNASMQGKTIFDLEENSPAFSAVQKILEHILVPGSPRTMNNEQ